ncbi:hypothetical protein DXG01_014228 [Tephrocybe rancida]|nr:hypothetical protein DXG01_014228 [Tephrocybe rancida]
MSDPVPRFAPLASHEFGGAIAVNIFAMLSSIALVSVAVRVVWLAIIQRISPGSAKPKEYVFFNTQLGYYAACLLIGNLFTDVSGLIGLRWVMDKGITEGSYTTFPPNDINSDKRARRWSLHSPSRLDADRQLGHRILYGDHCGAYVQFSGPAETPVCRYVCHSNQRWVDFRRAPGYEQLIMCTIGTTNVENATAAGPFINPAPFKFGGGYGVSGLSCGIRPIYPKAQFFYHLLPIFVASVLSAILYSVIFLVLRGTLNIKGGVRLTLDPYERWSSGRVTENYHRFVARVVNVALLYNTFRVLGPAFDATSYKESSMGSSGMNEKYDPSYGQWSSEKGYPTAPFRSPTIASFGDSPKTSIRPLLPVHQERSASIESYYSYSNSPSIGRAITPVNELSLQRSITPPEAVAQKFSPSTARSLGLHNRQGSNESMGLTAAPRRTRSPVLHKPSVEQLHIVQGTWSPVETLGRSAPRSTSAETFGKRTSDGYSPRMESASTPNYDPSSWDSRTSQSGSPKSRPLLSALNTGFGSPGSLSKPLPSPPRHSRSFSAVPTISPAPTGRQRAVTLDFNDWTFTKDIFLHVDYKSVTFFKWRIQIPELMQGADPLSRKPRVLFTMNSPEDVALFATGCDGDIGGTSTTHLELERSPAINESLGRAATAKFWGEMRLGVKPGMEGKVRSGYAGFRNKPRPSLFGNITEDVGLHEYLALRVRIAGDPKTRTSYFANIQTNGPMSSDLWQHRLYFQRNDNSWEDLFMPFDNFVRTNSGELSENQITMAKDGIRSIGISLLGGNSGVAGHYELGIDSIRIVNEEDVIRTPPGGSYTILVGA